MSPPAGRPVSRRPLAIAGELLVVGCLLWVYDQVRQRAELRTAAAVAHGRALLGLERRGGLDLERLLSGWTAAHRTVETVAVGYYQYAHVTVTMAVLVWLWWRRPLLYRWARTALVLVNLAGLAVFLLYPVAPPRLVPGVGVVDGAVAAGLRVLGAAHADQYGAMPSLHVAWAVWVALVLRRALPARAAGPALAYPLVTAVVVVLTGNHYLLDLPAGAAVAGLALAHHRLPAWWAQRGAGTASRPSTARPARCSCGVCGISASSGRMLARSRSIRARSCAEASGSSAR